MEASISTSHSTIRGIPSPLEISAASSQPSSPRSSTLPSPPDSPDSISSFPSLTSSFFFSSVPDSPPRPHSQLDHGRDSTQGLIIPSLTLPSALRQPTAYGKTLGDVRLLVLGEEHPDEASLRFILLHDNDDLVDVDDVESTDNGSVLRASTHWIEHRDAHGLERFEAAHNVEITQLPSIADNEDVHDYLQDILTTIHAPFHNVHEVLDPNQRPSALLSLLLASPAIPLYTALILLNSTSSPQDRSIIDSLSAHIPIIALPPTASHSRQRLKLSAFRPSSAIALRTGLFRSPETLALLRAEAADRFLRWREVERAVHSVYRTTHMARGRRLSAVARTDEKDSHASSPWNKAEWEAEWDATLSRDVASRLREGTITRPATSSPSDPPCGPMACDPLHLPSLFMFGLSLLTPLKARLAQMKLTGGGLGLALLSTLCAGIGIGLMVRG